MARIAGVDLPRDKRGEIAVQYIYGIGKTTAKAICDRAGVKVETRTKDLTDDEVRRIRDVKSDFALNLLVGNADTEVARFTGAGLVLLGARAFASGCTALTGVEAISNGVPAFKEPAWKKLETQVMDKVDFNRPITVWSPASGETAKATGLITEPAIGGASTLSGPWRWSG